MRPRASLKEVRHLEEKSSRGFRFLRHCHKQKVLLQYRDPPQKPKLWWNSTADSPTQNGTLRHQWTQEPENCDKQTVISVPLEDRRNKTWHSKEIHIRNQKSDGSQQKLQASYRNDLTPPTTDTNHWHSSKGSSHCKLTIWQASSQNTQHWREIHFRNKVWWTSTKGIHSRQLGRNPTINESDENTRTLIHQQKVDSIQRSYPQLLHRCCFNNKRLTVSHMFLQKRDPPRNKSLMDPNHWMHQSKPDNSIITERSGVPPTNEILFSTEIHFKNKLDTQQKQLPAPINHLKEEPSAPQSLSIFDST